MEGFNESLYPLFTRPSKAFSMPNLSRPGEANFEDIANKKVLVVGAGGLGCEILKDLALSGFKNIEVIDLDTIDLSNLNRQFLFRHKDIGKGKAEVAAAFIKERCGVDVTAHKQKIQDFPDSYYSDFDIIIAGLDNIEARRWLNSTVASLVEYDADGNPDFGTMTPLIDGGTEGFKGQARVFYTPLTSCYECSYGTLTPPKGVAQCTIRNTPRTPEHCIMFVSQISFPKLTSFEDSEHFEIGEKEVNAVRMDTDNPQHMLWITKRSQERADQYGIEGVTLFLTMQVVKNIIPAIASTNALISAVCAQEALKLASWTSQQLHNYFMYMGHDGAYARTWPYEKGKSCLVCGSPLVWKLDPSTTVETLITKLKEDDKTKLKNPSLMGQTQMLYHALKADKYQQNVSKPISDFIKTGEKVEITDEEALGRQGSLTMHIHFEEGAIYVPKAMLENTGDEVEEDTDVVMKD